MRGLKYLFTVPEGEKVTEKHFRRVLISSVCSILLCLSCLFSTTWALFEASIVSENNVIQMGTFEPKVVVTNAAKATWTIAFDNKGSITIPSGNYVVKVDSSDGSNGIATVSIPDRMTVQNGTDQPIYFDAGVYQIVITNEGTSRGHFCGSVVLGNLPLSLPGPTLYPADWQNTQAIPDQKDESVESIKGKAYQIYVPTEQTLGVYSCWGESSESQSSLIDLLKLYALFLQGSVTEVDGSALTIGTGETTGEGLDQTQDQETNKTEESTEAIDPSDPTEPTVEEPSQPTEESVPVTESTVDDPTTDPSEH